MSSSEVIALVAVISSGVIGFASLGFNFWNSSSERRQRIKDRMDDNVEWRRRILFEERFDAVQQAYKWAINIHRYTTVYLSERTQDHLDRRKTVCMDARDWYDENAIFLYDSLPQSSEFIGLINVAADGDGRGLESQYSAVTRELRERLNVMMSDLRKIPA
jgi:hypothetical protein